jgi:hypothetical protein
LGAKKKKQRIKRTLLINLKVVWIIEKISKWNFSFFWRISGLLDFKIYKKINEIIWLKKQWKKELDLWNGIN